MNHVKRYFCTILNWKFLLASLLIAVFFQVRWVLESQHARTSSTLLLEPAPSLLKVVFWSLFSLHMLNICIFKEQNVAWKMLGILAVMFMTALNLPLANHHPIDFMQTLLIMYPLFLAMVLLLHWGARHLLDSCREGAQH
jgi:hypothetical protein